MDDTKAKETGLSCRVIEKSNQNDRSAKYADPKEDEELEWVGEEEEEE
ncbi:unnamed protein product, partial [Dibothriocephalus latus]